MPYRRQGEALEVPTADGTLRIELGPDSLELRVSDRSVRISDRTAFVQAGGQSEAFRLTGRLVVARHLPRDDLSIWLEQDGAGTPAMRRLFGVAPISLLGPDYLPTLRQLEDARRRVRAAAQHLAADVVRAIELGTGRDPHKLLLVELADRHLVFACRLFRGQARLVMTLFADGRIAFPHAPREVRVDARIAVSVRGDCVRFADLDDCDVARVSVPWLGPDDRHELARRIAKLIARPTVGLSPGAAG